MSATSDNPAPSQLEELFLLLGLLRLEDSLQGTGPEHTFGLHLGSGNSEKCHTLGDVEPHNYPLSVTNALIGFRQPRSVGIFYIISILVLGRDIGSHLEERRRGV